MDYENLVAQAKNYAEQSAADVITANNILQQAKDINTLINEEQVTSLQQIKTSIKNAIVQKGVVINEQNSFAEYADKILLISSSQTTSNFYKCTSVNAKNKTWSGYKATIDSEGKYSFASELTTDLTYATAEPIPQQLYSADTSTCVPWYLLSGVPTPCYYDSGLSLQPEIAPFPLFLEIEYSYNSTFLDCIPCVRKRIPYKTPQTGFYSGDLPGMPVTGGDFTITAIMPWDCYLGGWALSTNEYIGIRIHGNEWDEAGKRLEVYKGDNVLATISLESVTKDIHHFAVTYAGSTHTWRFFVDGVFSGEATTVELTVPWNNYHQNRAYQGVFRSHAIYDSILNDDQIATLASELQIWQGLEVSGLDTVPSVYGATMSANGLYVRTTAAVRNTNYYPQYSFYRDEDEWSEDPTIYIQWDGEKWVMRYLLGSEDPDTYEWVEKEYVIGIGRGGNRPSHAEWESTGYGLPTVTDKYRD